ncbi:MAG: pyridoxal-phosphate dependent enzyme [Dehalococcoidia bacterium]|nr:pyridoxal-phosphate dependent enzyme [Dehalococcoidia bacterium]
MCRPVAPLAKREATAGYGASVELVDGPLSMAIDRARALAAERGELFVPPFDDPAVVAGQGTLGLEVLEQAPDLETVLVPAGGGGLLAGVALAVKSRAPQVRVVGVQTAAMPGIVESLRAGEARTVPAARTIADGVAVAGPSALTLELVRRYVDDVVTVSEEAIAAAVVLLLERTRLVVEGAGALGVAALLAGAAAPRGRTVVVLSSGNIDVNLLGRIVERGLLSEGRRRRVTIAAANVPGELARVTQAVASGRGNIIEVQHELVVAELPVGVARVTLRLELAGDAAFAELRASLLAAGLVTGTVTDFATPAAAAAVG